MLSPRGAIASDGDMVLLFHGHQNITPLRLKRGEVLHCKEGKFEHDAIIGKTLGTYITGTSNIKNDPAVATVLLLQNSADMWTQAVPHRTQIIYDTDIAIITFNLRLGPGKRVVEAGTGSGCLTHSLAKTVAPHGTVFTCDFHKVRCLEARRELRANQISPSLVSSNWRDVCTTDTTADIVEGEEADVDAMEQPKSGFGLPRASVDAVFLDVPAPWSALDNIRHVLKPGGMVCTFSPCIEQTQRTVAEMRSEPHDFVDLRTVECLTKFFDPVYKRPRYEGATTTVRLRPSQVSRGHSAYLTFARRRLSPAPGSERAVPDDGVSAEALNGKVVEGE